MNHGSCIRLLTQKALQRSKDCLLFCEGVGDGFFGTIEGLSEEYPEQCIELPCSENASVGMVLGAAMYDLSPILCFQRVEFALLALEQLVNNTSKINYLSLGRRTNPCLFRFIVGRGWGQGPSHSQSLEVVFAQIPGIDVFMPAFPEDSRYIFNTFQERESATISLEHRWIHGANSSNIEVKGREPYIVKSGSMLTICASSYSLLMGLRVAELAADLGISIEVINQHCLTETDISAIQASCAKTGRLLVIENGNPRMGMGMVLVGRLVESGITFDVPPKVIGTKSMFSPSSFRLSDEYYLSHRDIAEAASSLCIDQDSVSRELLSECSLIDSMGAPDQPTKGEIGPF